MLRVCIQDQYVVKNYSLIAPHIDAIIPMFYKGDFDLSDSGMRSALAYLQKQAPGKLWVALESYISDDNPIPKSLTRNLAKINDLKHIVMDWYHIVMDYPILPKQ